MTWWSKRVIVRLTKSTGADKALELEREIIL